MKKSLARSITILYFFNFVSIFMGVYGIIYFTAGTIGKTHPPEEFLIPVYGPLAIFDYLVATWIAGGISIVSVLLWFWTSSQLYRIPSPSLYDWMHEGDSERVVSADKESTLGQDSVTDSGTNDSTQSDTELADIGAFRTQEHLRGDRHRKNARHSRDEGKYDQAIEKYNKAKAAYEDALETARVSDRRETSEIEQKIADVDEELGEVQNQKFRKEVKPLRTTLKRAETLTEEGEFEKVQAKLEDLEADLTAAKEIATQSDFDDLDEEIVTLEQRYDELRTELAERKEQCERLIEEIETLSSTLTQAEGYADEEQFEQAARLLKGVESRLSSAKDSALQHEFDDLAAEIATLEQRREERLTEVTERLKAHPVPDKIPRAPNVSVEYHALTNKVPIGGGGNADVTKATLPTPDGDLTLAIKEPRMSRTLHTDQVERMLQEAETWDKLDDHDHIVGVVDYGSEPLPWIAMEYMNGGHLGARSGEMDIPQALWTAIAVTKGVRHAHRKGVAHLDLKPENILFRTVEDAWDVPKVADWGLSKHLLEHSKSVEGMSVEYAAPEQFDDDYGSADDITDVYQLGAVFYELFTGRPPFEGQPFKVIDMVKSEQPTPPSEIADVPEGLDEILLTALAKEKDDRYDDIILLRNGLQDLFDEW